MCFPASTEATKCSRCRCCGVAINTASTSLRSSTQTFHPSRARSAAPTSELIPEPTKTASNVAIAARPSSRLARQAWRRARMSIRFSTASMIIAARTGLGRSEKSGASTSSVRSTVTPDVSEARPVRAPVAARARAHHTRPRTAASHSHWPGLCWRIWPGDGKLPPLRPLLPRRYRSQSRVLPVV